MGIAQLIPARLFGDPFPAQQPRNDIDALRQLVAGLTRIDAQHMRAGGRQTGAAPGQQPPARQAEALTQAVR